MSDVSESLKLRWIASVEAKLTNGVDYLWPNILVIMSKILEKRGPVYKIIQNEPRLITTIGVEDSGVEDAKIHGEGLVKKALSRAKVQWLDIICLSITSNQIIDETIEQIRVFGNPNDTAIVLPLTRPEND